MTNHKIATRAVARTLLAGAAAALVGCVAPADPDPVDPASQTAQTSQAVAEATTPTILFRGNTANGGADIHHSYRIPAIISVGSDQLIAVAEGRVDAPDDFGNINLVMRRSLNNGDTWLAQEQIWNAPDRLGTIGNPTLVYDSSNGRVWLFASENDSKHSLGGAGGLTPVGVGDRRTWMTFSDDKGVSWATPKNITASVTPPGTTWDAMGPGIGIQIARGAKAGRLVIPARGRIIISDDHGASWSYLSTRATGSTTEVLLNETTVAEIGTAGWMYVNARSQNDEHRRQTKISKDHGLTWSKWTSDPALIESECQASLVRYNFNEPGRIMFFNPANTSSRDGMRIRISYDDGATWPISRVVDAGQGGYSSMTKTSDFHIAALYESGGGSDSNRDIKFTKFNLDWIRNGAAEPVNPDPGWAQVVRADLDGNGDDELGFYTTRDGTFAWYPMTAAGQLGTRLSATVIGDSWDVVLGVDPDGDGIDDLAFYDAQSGGFAVYATTPTGVLGARRSSTTLGAGWTSIVAADFDGDHHDELVFYNAANGGYAVYHTNPDGTLGARLSATTLGAGWSELVAVDVTGDGRPELAFYNKINGSFAVYPTSDAGALGTRLSGATLSKGWTAVERVQAAAGRAQLGFYDRTTGGFSIYMLDATGQLATRLATYSL